MVDNACFPVRGGVGGACLFEECEAHADCSPDPLLAERCVEGRCLPSSPCDAVTGEGCDGVDVCVQYLGEAVCLTPCEVFGAACPAGLKCVPSGNDLAGFCQPSGPAAVGAPCDAHAECAVGALCVEDGLGNDRCLALCDTQDVGACGDGRRCTSVSGRAGVCSADCESECSVGAARCSDDGRQACAQLDDDLCLEWGAIRACDPGLGCDDLSGECIDACAGDGACAHPLVPRACRGGRCVVRGDCDPSNGDGCEAPDECFLASADGSAGVCLEVCDPLDATCSDAADACVAFGGSAWCLRAGEVGAGGACDQSAECAAGLSCFDTPDGSGRCFDLCNFEEGGECDDGFGCIDAGIDGRLGVCNEVCEDACAEGESRCGPEGGIQTCGHQDGSLCRDWGPEAGCGLGERCIPETVECRTFCEDDDACPRENGIDYICDARTGLCDVPACALGDACEADQVCVPQAPADARDPGDPGFCLNTCDPFAPAECGAASNCDYYPTSDVTVELVCLPAGAAGQFERCAGVNCQAGFSCIPAFEGEDGETVAACARFCHTDDARECAAGHRCHEVGFFPDGVGICAR